MPALCGYATAVLALGLISSIAKAALVNVTIDDTLGDPLTGTVITYQPQGAWTDGRNCVGCTARPDASQMSNGTWHDGTFNAQPGSNDFPNQVLYASTTFNGTAVYVFCALARTTSSPTGHSDMSFFIDGELSGTFVKEAPGTPGFDYNVIVYSNTTLSPGQHRLTIQNGHVDGAKSLLILDRVVYSYDDGRMDTSAGSSDGGDGSNDKSVPVVIVGAVVGGIALLGVIIFAFWLYRRKHRAPSQIEKGDIDPQTTGDNAPHFLTTPFLTQSATNSSSTQLISPSGYSTKPSKASISQSSPQNELGGASQFTVASPSTTTLPADSTITGPRPIFQPVTTQTQQTLYPPHLQNHLALATAPASASTLYPPPPPSTTSGLASSSGSSNTNTSSVVGEAPPAYDSHSHFSGAGAGAATSGGSSGALAPLRGPGHALSYPSDQKRR